MVPVRNSIALQCMACIGLIVLVVCDPVTLFRAVPKALCNKVIDKLLAVAANTAARQTHMLLACLHGPTRRQAAALTGLLVLAILLLLLPLLEPVQKVVAVRDLWLICHKVNGVQ